MANNPKNPVITVEINEDEATRILVLMTGYVYSENFVPKKEKDAEYLAEVILARKIEKAFPNLKEWVDYFMNGGKNVQ